MTRGCRSAFLAGALLPSALFASEQPPGGAESALGSGPCPVSGMAPCALVLEGAGAPSASATCAAEPWSKLVRFAQPGRWLDSNRDGSFETVLEIRLDPRRDCGCARLRIEYGASVSNWTVHVGNSPTNNGHGGDLGTAPNAAEVQILERQLHVYTTAQSARRLVDRLLDVTLPPLAGRTVELEICEQALGARIAPHSRDPHPPQWRIETQNARLLFSLGPADDGAAPVEAGSIYAAFNRVIHVADGAPSRERTGSGVRRVEISLIP